MNSPLELIRSDLKSSQTYKVKETSGLVRLHLNELPWPPIPSVLNLYPEKRSEEDLKVLLAERYQVSSDNLLLTRGSSEGLDLLMRLLLRSGQEGILQCPPCFSLYGFFAGLNQVSVLNSPLMGEDFSFDLAAIKRTWRPGIKLIMLCNPNNPTGSLLGRDEIVELCEFFQDRAMVVVDEAYIEFCLAESVVPLIESLDNLIVLRSLSKAYGLAALRLGAILASKKVIEAFKLRIPPFRFSLPVLSLAIEILGQNSWPYSAVNEVIKEREILSSRLKRLSFIEKVYDSSANFLLIKTSQSKSLAQVLEAQGFAIRCFSESEILKDCLRITVGKAVDNQRLWECLLQVFPQTNLLTEGEPRC